MRFTLITSNANCEIGSPLALRWICSFGVEHIAPTSPEDQSTRFKKPAVRWLWNCPCLNLNMHGYIWIQIKNYQNIVYIQWKYDVTVYTYSQLPFLGPRWSAYLSRQAAASPLSHRWHVDLHHPGSHRLPGSGKISQWEQDHSWSYPWLGIAGRPDQKKHQTLDTWQLCGLWVDLFWSFLLQLGHSFWFSWFSSSFW